MSTNSFPMVMRDTKSWQMQVWISFGLAVFLCGAGLAYLPGQALERAFMVMGYVFCLVMVFVISKSIRDSHKAQMSGAIETPMWGFVVWSGFLLAMALTAWGLFNMTINETYRAFLGVCWFYLVSSAFTLAKTLRDSHESDLLEGAIKLSRSPQGRSSTPTPAATANNEGN